MSELKNTGWGFLPLPGEQGRMECARKTVDSVLELDGQEGQKMSTLFNEIRDALKGVEPIVELRYAGAYRYQVSQSFDAQVCASLSDSSGLLFSVTVNRFRNDSVEVLRHEHLRPYIVDSSVRTTENHGADVVRAFVMRFIREVLS